MKTSPVTQQQSRTTEASSSSMTQAERMRAAIAQAVAVAPGFLRGEVAPDSMAKTMVHAVNSYIEQERAAGNAAMPVTAETRSLQGALTELMTCGSGYLAGQCDAACVARTMTQMAQEFPAR